MAYVYDMAHMIMLMLENSSILSETSMRSTKYSRIIIKIDLL